MCKKEHTVYSPYCRLKVTGVAAARQGRGSPAKRRHCGGVTPVVQRPARRSGVASGGPATPRRGGAAKLGSRWSGTRPVGPAWPAVDLQRPGEEAAQQRWAAGAQRKRSLAPDAALRHRVRDEEGCGAKLNLRPWRPAEPSARGLDGTWR